MAWTTPRNWTTNELVTANMMNQQIRDNMNFLIAGIVPTGSVLPYGGILGTAPAGWLICDGAAVSRTTYAALFTAIGTSFGAGNGSTTFNLPDLRGRFPLGKDNLGGTSANRVTATQADNLGQGAGTETHTLTIPEMPAHTHSSQNNTGSNPLPQPAGIGVYVDPANGRTNSATSGSTGGGGAHNNMPPYITLNYIIKT